MSQRSRLNLKHSSSGQPLRSSTSHECVGQDVRLMSFVVGKRSPRCIDLRFRIILELLNVQRVHIDLGHDVLNCLLIVNEL